MATMAITAATPITMPSTERKVRMRLRSNALSAILIKVNGDIIPPQMFPAEGGLRMPPWRLVRFR